MRLSRTEPFTPMKLGLVLKFGLERMKEGITRIVTGLPEEPDPRKEAE